MIIPYTSLPSDTLNAIIEDFILREGTDYGEHDIALSDKIVQIKQQLKQKSIVLVYSELHETVNILPADQFEQLPITDD